MADTFWTSARENMSTWRMPPAWKRRYGADATAAAESLEDAMVLIVEMMIAISGKMGRFMKSDRPVRELLFQLLDTRDEITTQANAGASPTEIMQLWRRRKSALTSNAIRALEAL